jgi:hypothetical protein
MNGVDETKLALYERFRLQVAEKPYGKRDGHADDREHVTLLVNGLTTQQYARASAMFQASFTSSPWITLAPYATLHEAATASAGAVLTLPSTRSRHDQPAHPAS